MEFYKETLKVWRVGEGFADALIQVSIHPRLAWTLSMEDLACLLTQFSCSGALQSARSPQLRGAVYPYAADCLLLIIDSESCAYAAA